ncbi:unnamed protein product [Ectocarpus sp. 6 AP-2014]
MNINKLRTKAEGLVTQLTVKDECEKRVLDAVSNNKYAAPRSLLNEVAEDTFAHDSRYGTVMQLVWRIIASPPRNWRSISKVLILVDHLVKHGAERVVADVQQHIHDIACLNDFRYVEAMYDTGGRIREQSRELVNLMGNPDLVQAQRRNARDLKPQYNGYGGEVPPRLSGGRGSGARSSHDSSGGGGGGDGGGRNSGEINEDWRAGYDRSPTPPQVDARRVVGGRSESIDFDEGREGYSGRLSRFQEQERREASLASGGRRNSRDGAEGARAPRTSGGGGGGKGASSSKKRTDGKKKSSGPDLLSGDDPFPATAPSQPQNDFSSFGSFAAGPQAFQGGTPVAPGAWNGGAGVPPQQQQYQQQQFAPGSQAGQMVPYGQGGPMAQNQQQPGMQVQGQTGWGQQTPQGQQGMQQQGMQQQGMQPQGMQQQGGYGQGQGAQYPGQRGMKYPQQQQYGQLQQQMQPQPPQQHMYQQYQQQQQQQPIQPQQAYQPQQQQPYQQPQPFQQQQQQQQQPHNPSNLTNRPCCPRSSRSRRRRSSSSSSSKLCSRPHNHSSRRSLLPRPSSHNLLPRRNLHNYSSNKRILATSNSRRSSPLLLRLSSRKLPLINPANPSRQHTNLRAQEAPKRPLLLLPPLPKRIGWRQRW